MKKAALTFGLFSLVMVATSFATPQTNNSSVSLENSIWPTGRDGGATGGQKKADFHEGNDHAFKNTQLDFSSVNQAMGADKKVD